MISDLQCALRTRSRPTKRSRKPRLPGFRIRGVGESRSDQGNKLMNEYKLLLLPGDGIGPEVLDATMRVVGWYGQKGLPYKTEEALLGGAAIDGVGRPG